ncbi:hypothetical protein L3Y34_011697 [Caenorhabditis briggsae]|uniref:Uncharacterized protein n=1 Tax=Caenorhabditis briggsae TaxID=6238 RepID=A0AAE8ZPI3_CAEBR|nr:hypothetical protein L3Y34_011697 [Caenorhabditis briggsae]
MGRIWDQPKKTGHAILWDAQLRASLHGFFTKFTVHGFKQGLCFARDLAEYGTDSPHWKSSSENGCFGNNISDSDSDMTLRVLRFVCTLRAPLLLFNYSPFVVVVDCSLPRLLSVENFYYEDYSLIYY